MAKIDIYTTTYCSYCNAAKSLLTKQGATYNAIDVTNNDEKRLWLAQTTGQRTVPQIFINDLPIGGYNELAEIIRSDEFYRLTK